MKCGILPEFCPAGDATDKYQVWAVYKEKRLIEGEIFRV